MKPSWKSWFEQAATAIHEWLQQETHSFAELAELIRRHPDTVRSERTWLGLTYRFYSLVMNEATLKMETKVTREGKERILFLSFHAPRTKAAVYRAYDEDGDLADIVATPPLSEKTAPV
ncbi:hypothetical protein RA955_10465 [Geobacillus proteiniphilus]|uniref:Uncharacterized protein n=1 Tax=Geobacillus proteiniphilus TaxID=860353 RepID=A0A1Q5SWG5_9BACL|nr:MULTISPECIES: hypothetical protein [Geobacillus]OKO92371.1 hypothetical protein BRO54_2427 [Geobacillus proteiniphilus]OPX00902.1 hypothetical protein B1A75_17350 [Geobacillus sp. LEMMY01]WMJ18336.1 hypothetical protein RA955_10465 [Geobacillus proteiniphilus]